MTYAYSALRRHLRLDADNPPGGGNGTPPPPTPPPAGEDEGDDDLDESDAAKLKDALKKERQQRRDAQRSARTLQQEKEQRERADHAAADEAARKRGEFETVANTATQRAEKAEADLMTEREARKREKAETAIHLAARDLNFHDAEDAVARLMGQVEYGEDGAPKGVTSLVKKLADDKPYLVKQAGGGAFIPPTARGGQPPAKDVVGETLDRMWGKPA